MGVLAGQPSSASSVFHCGPAPSGGLSGKSKCWDLIRLLIMWIPEFLMVYKIRGGERAGWVMSRVGNGTGGK